MPKQLTVVQLSLYIFMLKRGQLPTSVCKYLMEFVFCNTGDFSSVQLTTFIIDVLLYQCRDCIFNCIFIALMCVIKKFLLECYTTSSVTQCQCLICMWTVNVFILS